MNHITRLINQYIQSKKSFAISKLPNSKQLCWWGQSNQKATQRFVMNSFDSKTTIQINTKPIYFSLSALNNPQILSIDLPESDVTYTKSKADYIDLINQCIDELQTNNLQKIVISRQKSIGFDAANNWLSVFYKLATSYPNAFVYVWYDVNSGIWIGATPELLLSYQNNRLTTMSLAGTKTTNRDFTNKEKLEQQLVTDYLVDLLKPYGQVGMQPTNSHAHGTIQHLRTSLWVDWIDEKSIDVILKSLHPTPAVCGLPKQEAMDWILNNEGYKREFYTGYVGIESGQERQLFVNLRCAKLINHQALLYVGGGILSQSKAQDEWTETELKSETIGQFL